MKNVRKWAGMVLAVVLVFSALSMVALAQDPAATPQAHRYVDADGDGVCDLFVDEDGDGVCDNEGAWGRGRSAGRGMMNRSSNWADADGDGVCDNMVDEDGDGVCDLRGTQGRGQGTGAAPADGAGTPDGFRGGMRGGRGRMQAPAGNSNTSFGGRWS
jgi:hypothetical protein